jgi:hypothetical protein
MRFNPAAVSAESPAASMRDFLATRAFTAVVMSGVIGVETTEMIWFEFGMDSARFCKLVARIDAFC